MSVNITGGRLLLPSGAIEAAELRLSGGMIERIGSGSGVTPAEGSLDARGLLVAPGIIDLHGDAFERQIMPRPGIAFPIDQALLDTDRQMVANGITTAFHGLTYSWETGLRGRATALALLAALEQLGSGPGGRLGCDTRIHLRWETFNVDAVDEIVCWLDEGRIGLLAFNDHFDEIVASAVRPLALAKYAGRAQSTPQDYLAQLDRVGERRAEVPAAIRRLAETALGQRVCMASHDDYTADKRRWYHRLGCHVAEFPRSREALEAAGELGNAIVMGAPNIIRGGSHMGSIGAAEAIGEGLCSVLVSDYFYPTLPQCPFDLAARSVLSLGEAWRLVSGNAAEAAGLGDRGWIAEGQRADLVLIDDADPTLPRVVATLVAGNPVYAAGEIWRFRI
jgi:alpha-D-ribose 1-methylphosphonate 5-triphosphate diphosphatase